MRVSLVARLPAAGWQSCRAAWRCILVDDGVFRVVFLRLLVFFMSLAGVAARVNAMLVQRIVPGKMHDGCRTLGGRGSGGEGRGTSRYGKVMHV